jgi:hypothetical protein
MSVEFEIPFNLIPTLEATEVNRHDATTEAIAVATPGVRYALQRLVDALRAGEPIGEELDIAELALAAGEEG